MANETTTTDYAPFITEWNKRELKPLITHEALVPKLGDKQDFPEGEGTTAVIRQPLPLAVVSASLSTSLEASDPTPADSDVRKRTVNLYTMFNSVKPTRLTKKTSFNRLLELRDQIKANTVESLEQHYIKTIQPQFLHLRADWDPVYQKRIVASGAGVAGGTTIVSDGSGLRYANGNSESDDHWGGSGGSKGKATCITRTSRNYGETRDITNFVATGGTFTVDAFDYQVAAADEFIIAIPTGLTTGDTITLPRMARIQALLNDLMIKGAYWKFSNPRGMGLKLLVSSGSEYDISQDTDWKAYQNYGGAGSKGWEQFEVGMAMSSHVLQAPFTDRCGVDGLRAAAGAVYCEMFLSKHAFTALDLTALRFVTVSKEDSGNLLGRWYFSSWEVELAMDAFGPAGVVVWTVPSALV